MAKAKIIPPLRIDIGCGSNKRAEFLGVDSLKLPNVDVVCDLRKRWPWKDDSVDEANCAHFIEHLTNLDGKWERIHFFNELYRVLKVGAKCSLVFPHWASNRYYGDPTHKEPFSEMGFCYLNADWRVAQAPHTDKANVPYGYDCHFEVTYGYSMHPAIVSRSQEYQQFAMQNHKEACQDIVATMTKAAMPKKAKG